LHLINLNLKAGQSSTINVVEDDNGLSAGLRIMSTLSDELVKYCLSKERRRVGEICLKHKNSMVMNTLKISVAEKLKPCFAIFLGFSKQIAQGFIILNRRFGDFI
jgi:hypothetical protein